MVSGKKDTSRQTKAQSEGQFCWRGQLQLESLEQNIILDIQLLALAPLGAW